MAIDTEEREQLILDAAADHIIRHGYDKTTIADVADAVGLSRGLVYVQFKSKEALLEALIEREILNYGNLWLEYIESDPQGGSIGSTYRGVLSALKQSPFMAAIVTRSEGIFGKYLRKPGNVFATMNTPDLMISFLQSMQEAGVVRQDVNIKAMAHIMDILSSGLVNSQSESESVVPPYEDLLETMAEMLDRMLLPEDTHTLEAGKAVLRQIAENFRQQYQQKHQEPSKQKPSEKEKA